MTKTVKGNEVTLEFDNVHEARGFLTALASSKTLFLQHQDIIIEIKNVEDLCVIVTFKANIRSLDKDGLVR